MIRLYALLFSLFLGQTVFAEDLQSIDNLQQFASLIRWSGVAFSLFIIIGAWLFLRFIQSIVDGVSSQFAQRRMLMQKLQSFFQFFIYMSTAVAIFMLSFRVDDRVLALIGGTIAVSVGFALKDLTASFIAGLTVMIDRPFQVGDRVTFEGHYGDIIAIGLRSVRMQTLNDDIVTIPNNKFLNDVTVSGNYGGIDMQVVIPFYIGMDQDINKARDIIQEAASSSRYIHLPKPVVVLVKQTITENYLVIQLTCKAYVVDIKLEKLFETDITLRVMQEFRKEDIMPPTIAIQKK
ncbi:MULTISPECIES: mechanosensitive ion channel family protein [Aliivibrio]|jgi:small-conductance mechanosensitive channel|uniref:Small-conductance mechanosensitive channel n=3 Tax=Aliivibrio TaxID=511678 RepID=A0A1B9P0M1_ALILO|nr:MULTISPECIES: mechanosensitive ion channel domain-containing protein [Aliivibrio]AZL84857.1 mechanosensitive ion channel family protein [Aliivibrio salmonicida]OCH21851.1 potassium transporter KefA [Aliivibrio logei]CAQ79209.1 mechanosensitive ion channel [Aliivibrio salmonicida LFI1238]